MPVRVFDIRIPSGGGGGGGRTIKGLGLAEAPTGSREMRRLDLLRKPLG